MQEEVKNGKDQGKFHHIYNQLNFSARLTHLLILNLTQSYVSQALRSGLSIPIMSLPEAPTKPIDSNAAKDRKVRNRESAYASRKRKLDEVEAMKSQMKSLEDEVKLLRQRLATYEGDNNQNDRNRKSNINKATTANSNAHMIKEQLLLSQ